MAKKTLDDVAAQLAAASSDAGELQGKLTALAAIARSLSLTQAPKKAKGAERERGWATFAEWLREKLAAAELTEQRAADLSGGPYGTIHNFLNIAGRTPNLWAALHLVHLFGGDANELFQIKEYFPNGTGK